ncbi:MAG: hypothetical protein FJ387_01910 [Verrucomicrobia bacterium]|nr:hypothetical protein [Verrucomicrobiota bacterium]
MKTQASPHHNLERRAAVGAMGFQLANPRAVAVAFRLWQSTERGGMAEAYSRPKGLVIWGLFELVGFKKVQKSIDWPQSRVLRD